MYLPEQLFGQVNEELERNESGNTTPQHNFPFPNMCFGNVYWPSDKPKEALGWIHSQLCRGLVMVLG